MPPIPCLVFQRQQSSQSTEKPVVPPSAPEATPLSQGAAVSAPGSGHFVVLGSASGGPEAATSVLLSPLPPPPALAGPQPGVWAQHSLARLGAVLGTLQRQVRRLQWRHEQHQVQLQALEQLAQQLCKDGLPARPTRACCAW